MDTVARNVTDLSADERQIFEGVLGQALRDDQRVIVGIVAEDPPKEPSDGNGQSVPHDQQITIKREGDIGILPDWCAIFADLSDEEIAELESLILDRSESRSVNGL